MWLSNQADNHSAMIPFVGERIETLVLALTPDFASKCLNLVEGRLNPGLRHSLKPSCCSSNKSILKGVLRAGRSRMLARLEKKSMDIAGKH
jgi:hypothetical protein